MNLEDFKFISKIFQIVWIKETTDTTIAINDDIQFRDYRTTVSFKNNNVSVLTINYVDKSDEGEYSCRLYKCNIFNEKFEKNYQIY